MDFPFPGTYFQVPCQISEYNFQASSEHWILRIQRCCSIISMHIPCHRHETWPDDNIVPVSAVVVIGISAAKSSKSMVGFNLEKCTFGGTCPRSKRSRCIEGYLHDMPGWVVSCIYRWFLVLYTKNNLKTLQRDIILYQQQQQQQKHPPAPASYETASNSHHGPSNPTSSRFGDGVPTWIWLSRPHQQHLPNVQCWFSPQAKKKVLWVSELIWIEKNDTKPQIEFMKGCTAHLQQKQWSFKIFHKMKEGVFDKSELQRLKLREF